MDPRKQVLRKMRKHKEACDLAYAPEKPNKEASNVIDQPYRTPRSVDPEVQAQELAEAEERVRNIGKEILKQEELRRTMLSDIIATYCEEHKDMTLHKLTAIASVSYSAVRAFLRNENRSLSLATYTKLAAVLNIPLLDLLGITPYEDYRSPLIDIRIYEYPCNLHVDRMGDCQIERFNRNWIRRITNSLPENLFMIHMDHSDMYPDIHDGDSILIDLSVRTIREDGMYLLDRDSGSLLRRVEIDMNNRDNLKISLLGERGKSGSSDVMAVNTRVLGRVVWGCHRI